MGQGTKENVISNNGLESNNSEPGIAEPVNWYLNVDKNQRLKWFDFMDIMGKKEKNRELC
jgi:hypothetical protein